MPWIRFAFSQAKQNRTESPVKNYTNEADIKPEFPGGISIFKTLIMSKLNSASLQTQQTQR
jgi:hypothetical protein